MGRCIFDDVAYAYCPKFDDDRRIRLRLIELVERDGSKVYKFPTFNCLEQFRCERFNRRDGCPFIVEVANRFG